MSRFHFYNENLFVGGPPGSAGGSWSLWPFRRSGSNSISENSKKVSDVESGQEADVEKEWPSPKSDKMHKRELTPTPEQLLSLNLAEGQNTVTFTFSTSVLGPQKVSFGVSPLLICRSTVCCLLFVLY